MQQTQKYRFNLIESSDTFSAQPLNDNMEKVEGALAAADSAVAAHRAEVNAALSTHRAEVNSALSTHRAEANTALAAQAAKVGALPRIISGTYTGTGTYGADHPTVLEFPDAERPPVLILICDPSGDYQAILTRGTKGGVSFLDPYFKHNIYLTWTDKGLRWYSMNDAHTQLNGLNTVYSYVAFI